MLDSLFLNVARVSYIDPAFDRCSLAHEWLSICDTFRSEKSSNNTGAMMSVQNHHIPTAAAALHLLCRVEQRPDLVFSIREFFDNRFQMENNQSLVQRFAEGNLPSSRCSRSIHLMVMETIPYALWILSSGHGTSALERSTASLELLNKNELTSFQRHANLLYTLGLTYITAESAPTNSYKNAQRQTSVRMEPPITRLVSYAGWDQSNVMKRRQIPPGVSNLLSILWLFSCIDSNYARFVSSFKLKLLLAQRASQERNSEIPGDDSDQLTKQDAPNADLISTKRKPDAVSLILPVTKKTKAPSPNSVATSHNFLLIGARKALEAKSARTAARVGYDRSKKDKKAHTGSGVPLPHVLRLKFVKGYTEAVRTPCYLKDLV
jgi:chromosome transmission fidelity protein 18